MRKTVWKFPATPTDGPVTVEMPMGAQLLAIGPDPQYQLAVWALVDKDAPFEHREIFVVGTGWDLEVAMGAHVGTAHVGGFVWHLFDGVDIFNEED